MTEDQLQRSRKHCPACGRSMTPAGLTKAQRRLLAFIVKQFDQTGMAPTYEEMAAGTGVTSFNGIHKLIKQLESRGWIKHSRSARGISIIWRPPAEAK